MAAEVAVPDLVVLPDLVVVAVPPEVVALAPTDDVVAPAYKLELTEAR